MKISTLSDSGKQIPIIIIKEVLALTKSAIN